MIDSTSAKKEKSIYQEMRERCELSRADATKVIPGDPRYPGMGGIAEYKLVRLEQNPNTIQPYDVVQMAKRYNAPELRNYYCCHDCPIGQIDAPEVTFNNGIHEILVSMAVSLKNVNHNKIRLMEILEDERISPEEKQDFNKISTELEHISMTIEALQLWCEKMKVNEQ